MIHRGSKRRACSSSCGNLQRADNAATRSRPWLAAITSSALVPMLPVEPKTATFFVATGIGPFRGDGESYCPQNRVRLCQLGTIVQLATHVPARRQAAAARYDCEGTNGGKNEPLTGGLGKMRRTGHSMNLPHRQQASRAPSERRQPSCRSLFFQPEPPTIEIAGNFPEFASGLSCRHSSTNPDCFLQRITRPPTATHLLTSPPTSLHGQRLQASIARR